jgi:hypothetical protein
MGAVCDALINTDGLNVPFTFSVKWDIMPGEHWMPFSLPLPRKLKVEGWKVKIREKERVEPPHVTVMHKADEWRLGLRDRQLLVPPGGRIRDIDADVMAIIDEHWQQLIESWDEKYPENPVSSAEDGENGEENGG